MVISAFCLICFLDENWTCTGVYYVGVPTTTNYESMKWIQKKFKKEYLKKNKKNHKGKSNEEWKTIKSEYNEDVKWTVMVASKTIYRQRQVLKSNEKPLDLCSCYTHEYYRCCFRTFVVSLSFGLFLPPLSWYDS